MGFKEAHRPLEAYEAFVRDPQRGLFGGHPQQNKPISKAVAIDCAELIN